VRKIVLAAVLLCACADSDTPEAGQPAPLDSAGVQTAAPDSAAPLRLETDRIIGFLSGQAPFDSITVADSVTLYMNPEGTVIQRTLTREQLRDTMNWSLQWGRGTYRISPPKPPAVVQTRVGHHFRCQGEVDLGAMIPQLAAQPHVGVRVDPPGADSCLQIWFSTFVFDTSTARPRLVAVVYDQFEW
jgi:hypothetical protein